MLLETVRVEISSISRLSLRPPTPNPFNPSSSIVLLVPDHQAHVQAQLAIYDARGRRVAVLHDGPLRPGRMEFVWHGQDDWGAEAGSGVYRALLTAGVMRLSARMTLVR